MNEWIMWSLKRRRWPWGGQFMRTNVWNRHRPCSVTMAGQDERHQSQDQARLYLALQPFLLTVHYCKGHDHANTDFLSWQASWKRISRLNSEDIKGVDPEVRAACICSNRPCQLVEQWTQSGLVYLRELDSEEVDGIAFQASTPCYGNPSDPGPPQRGIQWHHGGFVQAGWRCWDHSALFTCYFFSC